jgi:hypothetical protein
MTVNYLGHSPHTPHSGTINFQIKFWITYVIHILFWNFTVWLCGLCGEPPRSYATQRWRMHCSTLHAQHCAVTCGAKTHLPPRPCAAALPQLIQIDNETRHSSRDP